MIYLVEDDPSIRKLITYTLTSGGFEIEAFESGEQLFAKMDKRPSLFLLDIMLPGMDGLEILGKIRDNSEIRETPVMMLTAKGTEYDKVIGLDSGADDYLAKPFGMMELLARVKALLRRRGEDKQKKDIEIGDIVISPAAHTVKVGSRNVGLTLKEFNLLLLLMENEGIALDRDRILNSVWGYSFDGENRTVDVHVRHLREKLGEQAGGMIETVKGIGYRLRRKEN